MMKIFEKYKHFLPEIFKSKFSPIFSQHKFSTFAMQKFYANHYHNIINNITQKVSVMQKVNKVLHT